MRLRQTFALIFAGVFLQGCLEAVPSQTPSSQPAAQPASATTVAATASNAPAYPVPLATVAMTWPKSAITTETVVPLFPCPTNFSPNTGPAGFHSKQCVWGL